MKILLSNKFYYPKGGDCVYSLELEKLLRDNGNDVAFFSMEHPLNYPSKYSEYFPSEVNYTTKSFKNITEQIRRPLVSKEVKRKFQLLLKDFRPDIVHVNNIHSQLSPIIVKEAYKMGIPVVWTLHDYKLLCPRYDSLLKGKPCELCYKDKSHVIRNKCLKNSLPASILAYAEAMVWNQKNLEKYTSAFICPSSFIKAKMIKGGFDSNKLHVLHNFINVARVASRIEKKEPYYCYVGRLSEEKGIETLCAAAIQVPNYHLYIIGTGPQEDLLKNKYASANITFLGHKNWEELQGIVSKAQFLVIPSECYENNPLSVIEALTNGTPIIGAKSGGIPELIEEGFNGLLYTPGDVIDLKTKIEYFFDHMISKLDHYSFMKKASSDFSSSLYYEKLMNIYSKVSSSVQNISQDN